MTDQHWGLLSGEEIQAQGLVVDADQDFYRASTYDLTVGEIIPAGSTARPSLENEDFILPPGGTVRVVSRESVRLPNNITGHVLLKNELCRSGVLAINIGVIDPCFDGPISSTLINFGRADFPIPRGQPFLRVSFLRCPPSAKAATVKWTRQNYLKSVKQEVLAFGAETFLNVEDTAKKTAERAFGNFKEWLIVSIPVGALLLAVVTIFIPLGVSYTDKFLSDRTQRDTQMERSIEKKLNERYESRLKELSDQVAELQRTAAGRSTANRAEHSGKR
jgi:deoxycytidine triphosphate deaminase